MVASLPIARSDCAADRAALVEASEALTRVQQELLETMETETVVRIQAARNLPQGSATHRTERDAAIQLALRVAADVPLEVLRLCGLGLTHAALVAEHGSRAAANEVRLAVTLRVLMGSNPTHRLPDFTPPQPTKFENRPDWRAHRSNFFTPHCPIRNFCRSAGVPVLCEAP